MGTRIFKLYGVEMILFLVFDKHIFQRESTKKGVVLIQATLEDVHSLYKVQDDIFELRYTSFTISINRRVNL